MCTAPSLGEFLIEVFVIMASPGSSEPSVWEDKKQEQMKLPEDQSRDSCWQKVNKYQPAFFITEAPPQQSSRYWFLLSNDGWLIILDW